ncbi:MAG: PAS domain S-box protein [Kofleriaceae bacterium]
MSLEHDAYRLLFEAHPRPMYVADRDTLQILIVNDAACELYGWSREELLAMTIRELRPREELGNFDRAYADATKIATSTYSRAGRHCTKDGRVLDVTLEIRGLELAGRPVSLAVVTDITGIGEVERRFQLMVEHSADGIVLTNRDNIVEYVSPGGERILGFTASEAVGKPASTRLHPDDVALWRSPDPGETRYHIARARHSDGSWRWVESTTTNLTHDPAIRAYVANYRDITQRKLAEDALVESEANFRALIERSPTATFVHREGCYLYVNPAAVAMLGYHSADEIVGRSVLEFIHPDDREMVRARMAQTEQTGGTPPGAGRMLRADGAVLVIEAEGIRLDFDGKPSNVVMGHDVTQRHEVFARMAMADRMLTVGTLAAGVAHEINNPLSYISSNIDVLATELPILISHGRSRLTGDDFHALVSDVREGVVRVSGIVRDLLALSRNDEASGPVDIVAVLALSIKMAHNELRHRARVVQSFPEPLPLVDADASKLGQVFLNLLLNAAQAIAEGHTDQNEVRVSARATERGVVVAIEDTGTGIPENVMPRIFDPFFTTKARGVGTGLGLSISHQIVRSMGGEITVVSTLGRGSTFRVTLPAITTQPATHAVAVTVSKPMAARVLVIDDEVAVGRAIRLLLAPDNDVLAVTSGQEALARLASGERFDAILCDLMMPDISGIELYNRLARVAPECTSRIIFMTGGAFTQQARDFLANLDRPHVGKPFTEAQLRRAIESVMR